MSYIDGDIAIVIERVEQYGAVYYVADVVLSDPSLLMTAFAKGKYGRNITQRTSVMAGENNAIFAVNGDYYGFRNSGLIIRNGVFYRDVPRRSPDNTSAVIDANGDMFVVTEGQVSGQGLSANGAWQSFSFGPALIDGGVKTAYAAAGTRSKHPRTAFGQAGPLHYVFVVVDGRTSESSGMSFSVLADVLAERGCHVAYNLDGGGSSCMWFNGKVVNTPSDGTKIGERAISDIIYIPASLAGDAQ
jgi:exopolysaccharide biosynthesis protein